MKKRPSFCSSTFGTSSPFINCKPFLCPYLLRNEKSKPFFFPSTIPAKTRTCLTLAAGNMTDWCSVHCVAFGWKCPAVATTIGCTTLHCYPYSAIYPTLLPPASSVLSKMRDHERASQPRKDWTLQGFRSVDGDLTVDDTSARCSNWGWLCSKSRKGSSITLKEDFGFCMPWFPKFSKHVEYI